MLAPCLHDLSKDVLKQVPQGTYRNLNSALSEWTNYKYYRNHSLFGLAGLLDPW